jgi:hypothetical protein
MLNAELYDRSARIRQCFNYQQYGHVGSTCSNSERYGHCAGSHQTRDCMTAPQDRRKCANCASAHASWSQACEYRQREVNRIAQLALNRPRYHREPVHTASSLGSRPPSPERCSGASSTGNRPRPRATVPERHPGASSTEINIPSEPVDSAAHAAPQANSGAGSTLNEQAPREEDTEPQDPSSSGAQAPEEEPRDVDMTEASRAMTPGTELTEVSRNARRRLPRKAAAAARRGSGSMSWPAAVDELIALKGIHTFQGSVLGHTEALGPQRTRSSALIRVDGPRRSPRISTVSRTTSLASGSTLESVLNTNGRKRRRTDGGNEYDGSQALVLAGTGAGGGLQRSNHALTRNVRRLTAPPAQDQ